ncbi:hypothetical protein QZN17_05050 [Burkholderia multivorans]|nr:hypothetical protein [Burkholderia multivorans]
MSRESICRVAITIATIAILCAIQPLDILHTIIVMMSAFAIALAFFAGGYYEGHEASYQAGRCVGDMDGYCRGWWDGYRCAAYPARRDSSSPSDGVGASIQR